LRPRGAAGDDVDLDLGNRIVVNPALVAAMASLDVHLDGDVIADLAMREDGFDPRPVLRRVAETCRDVPGFEIDSRYVVSTFVTAWPPLLRDLADEALLSSSDVVAALAGDAAAAESAAVPASPEALTDAAAEIDAHLPLDLDDDQLEALRTAVAGSHLVVDSPPGTGASQTIAALIAVLAAAGKRVLLLSQKRAALDAVLARLGTVGLDDVVLDLADAGADRRRVVRELAQTLDRAGAVPQPEPSALAGRRDDLQRRLDDHVEALHEPREPWGSSAYEAQLALAELTGRRPAPRSRVRVRGDQLHHLDADERERIKAELEEAARLGVFHGGPDDDPWFGARLTTPREADEAHERATRLSETGLPQARQRLTALLAEVGMPAARNVEDWHRVLSLLGDVRSTLEVFSSKVYDTSLADVVAATGTSAWRSEHGVRLGAWQRRKIRRHARSLLRPGRPPGDLHAALVRAADERRRWQQLAGRGSVPRLPSGLAAAEQAHRTVDDDLTWLADRLQDTPAGGALRTDDLDALSGRLELLAHRTTSLPLVPKVVALRERLAAVGLEPLLDDLAQRDVAAESVGAELDLVWWTSLLQHVAETDPRYGQHAGDELRELVEELVAADTAQLELAAQQARRLAAGRLVRALDRHADQAQLVRAEAARDRRWRPLRELVRLAPDVLAAARPCWTMSPLVVPQVLPPDARFDVVVLDEGAACRVDEVAPALARGRQVVVVGDPAQPRPAGSVLAELMDLLPVVRLRTQHAALNEQVVEFANTHAYGGSLQTLPSPSRSRRVHLHLVDGTGMLVAGQDAVESTDAEVDRVVELVVSHVRERPQESLGVVTLTSAHAERVEAALRVQLSHHPDVATFVSAAGPHRFFVKTAEHASGDTRDAIILSVGFGRTPHGRVLHSFGPVSADGGERLLISATTRARQRLSVVAAFGADDLDPERLSAPGARLLRMLLAHAARGASVAAPQVGQPDLLLADLAARLRSDLEVQERYGLDGQAIDLALGADAGTEGDWLVAVESDGPAYAATSARQRDRLRPQELARRGWFHQRVWSTDVFRDPAREVARIRGAVAAAQRARGVLDAPAVSTDAPAVRWDSEAPSAPRPTGRSASPRRSPWTAVAPQRRGERPRVPTGRPIEDYREAELDAVVAWICSDTLLRTQEQVAALVRQQLGFVRRSSTVDAVVAAAIARVVARGDARTSDAPANPSRTTTGENAQRGRRRSGDGVQAHDLHERWLLDQRPPHWD
jgi:hypothetical protein